MSSKLFFPYLNSNKYLTIAMMSASCNVLASSSKCSFTFTSLNEVSFNFSNTTRSTFVPFGITPSLVFTSSSRAKGGNFSKKSSRSKGLIVFGTLCTFAFSLTLPTLERSYLWISANVLLNNSLALFIKAFGSKTAVSVGLIFL